jgi:hypothetical protein
VAIGTLRGRGTIIEVRTIGIIIFPHGDNSVVNVAAQEHTTIGDTESVGGIVGGAGTGLDIELNLGVGTSV